MTEQQVETVAAEPETLYMKHDGSGPLAPVSRAAFDAVWSEKGWQLVDTQAAERAAVLVGGPTDQLDVLHVPELKEIASTVGVELPAGARKADIVTAIRDASPVEVPPTP